MNSQLEKYKGRVVRVSAYSTPGAWDFYLLPEYTYSAVAVDENGEIVSGIPAGDSNDGACPEPDASPEVMAIYEAHLKAREEERKAKEAEENKHRPEIGKRMMVKAGKNKGFVGDVVFVGETRYGMTAKLVAEDGKSVFTKPHNLQLVSVRPTSDARKGDSVKVNNLARKAEFRGRVGVVEYRGQTKYSPDAVLVVFGEEKGWFQPHEIEASDEKQVKALLAG